MGELGIAGVTFALLFLAGALRNVAPEVQFVADVNNYQLPLWLVILGVAVIRFHRTT